MSAKKPASRKKAGRRSPRSGSGKMNKLIDGLKIEAPDVTSTVQLLESKHYGLLIVRVEDLKVLYVSRRMTEITGYDWRDRDDFDALDVVVPEDRERLLKIIQARIRGDQVEDSNRYSIMTKSGQRKVLESFSAPVIYENHLCLYIMVHDVTEKMLMNAKLQESGSRFESLYQLSPDAILTINENGVITSVNSAAEKLTEYKAATLLGRNIDAIPVWQRNASLNIRRLSKSKAKHLYHITSKRKKQKTVEIHLNTYTLASGEKETFLLLRDVTDQKSYENRLIESEAKYRTVADNIADGIAIVLDGRCVYCNRNYLRLFGYKKDEILKRSITKVFPRKSKTIVNKLITDTLKSGKASDRIELDALHKNGSKIHLLMRTAIIEYENLKAVQLSIGNITIQKEAEIELRDTEERFRKLVENANYGFYLIDLETRKIYYLNKYGRELISMLKDRVGSLDYFDLIPNQFDLTQIRNLWKKRKQGAADRVADTLKIKAPNGDIKWIKYDSSVITYKGRKCIQGFLQDITQNYEVIERLRTSETRLQAIFQSIDDLIFVHDKNGRFVRFDQPMKKDRLYMHPDNFIGKTMHEVLPEEIAGQFDEAVSRLKKTGKPQSMTYSMEIDGQERWFSSQITPMYDKEGKFDGMTSVVREITTIIKANLALKHERDFSNSILNTANSLILSLDHKSRIRIFNDECERVLGYKREEVLGKYYPRIFLPKDKITPEMRDGTVYYKTFARRNHESTLISKSGRKILVAWSTTAIEGKTKEDFVLVAIGQDITDKKKAELALRDSELKFRAIFENTSDGISIYEYRFGSRKPILIDCNDSFTRLSGRSKRELFASRDLRKLYIENVSTGELEEKIKLAEQGKHIKGTYSWIRPDGRENYIEYEATPVVLGNKILVYQIDRDITERKITHDRLRESEEKYRSVVDNIGIGISLLSRDMRILSMNDQMKRWFPGIKVDNNPICFKSYNLPARKSVCTYCPAVKTFADGRVHEDVTETPSGDKIRNFRIITSPIKDQTGEITAVIEMVEDITERNKAEEEIRKFKLISDRASYGTAIANLDGTLQYVNEAFAAMHGYKAEELFGKHLSIFHNKEQIPRVNKLNKKLVETGSYTAEEVWHKHRDGSVFPTLMNATVVYDDKKRPMYFSANAVNISELKKAEDELQRSKSQYEILVENVNAIIAVIDFEGRFQFVNELGARALKVKVSDIIGKNMMQFFPRDVTEQQLAAIRNVIKTGKQFSGESKSFVNGHWEWYDTTIQPYENNTGSSNAALVITNNITDRKQAEMVLKNQRDVLRKITSDVIKIQEEERRRISMELHDSIGQSLSLTKLQIQNIAHSCESTDTVVYKDLENIAKILTDSISDLRRISANLRPVILDNLGLWPSIDWYLKDFAKKTNLNIEINIQPIDLGLSRSDEAHFFRVIQEIMINIQKHSNAQNIKFTASKNKEHAIFVISEDGVGFNLEDIYEPNGRVRGMGLINMMERVKIVNGKLDIRSKPSGGTDFMLEMPYKK